MALAADGGAAGGSLCPLRRVRRAGTRCPRHASGAPPGGHCLVAAKHPVANSPGASRCCAPPSASAMAVAKQAAGLRDDLSKALASKVSRQACPSPRPAGGVGRAWLLLPLEPASTSRLSLRSPPPPPRGVAGVWPSGGSRAPDYGPGRARPRSSEGEPTPESLLPLSQLCAACHSAGRGARVCSVFVGVRATDPSEKRERDRSAGEGAPCRGQGEWAA